MTRRWRAIAWTTALEIASEPLALLLTVSAVAVLGFATVFHIHQFGEAPRMARDASLSSLLVLGSLFAVFCTIRTVRREIESGTLQTALAHPVSRAAFLTAKAAGAFLSCCVFFATVTCASAVIVAGAEVGGQIASPTGEIPTEWGVAVVLDACIVVLPLAVAAVLNRFARFRYVATATFLALAFSFLAAVACFAAVRAFGFAPTAVSAALKMVPACLMLLPPLALFVAAAAAFSARLRDNAAAAACGLLALAFLPLLGNYYLSQALSRGGSVALSHVLLAFAATAPLVAFFMVLGVALFDEGDAG